MTKSRLQKFGSKFGKLTMKDPYAKRKLFSEHIRGYIDLLRPFTLMAPAIVSMSIICASLVYNMNYHGLMEIIGTIKRSLEWERYFINAIKATIIDCNIATLKVYMLAQSG